MKGKEQAGKGRLLGRGRYERTRWLFLRLLGASATVAMLSLAVQYLGLAGEEGILPAADSLERLKRTMQAVDPQASSWLAAPSILRLDASDASIVATMAVGTLGALLLLFDVAPLAAILAVFVSYLSLMTAGGVFFRYQWDLLLLESLFVGAFLSPLRLRPRRDGDPPPPRAVRWLPRVVVFKLMFLSGWSKIASGDPSWEEGTAMLFHYFTQPLPNGASWWVHTLPEPFHRASAVLTLVIEVVFPFLIFLPRPFRYVPFFGFTFLFAMMGITGNFGFFHLLSFALTVSILDDGMLGARSGRVRPRRGSVTPDRRLRLPRALSSALAVGLITINAFLVFDRAVASFHMPEPVFALVDGVRPLGLVNSYALFAVMTTSRPEIVIEGTLDGSHWEPYRFSHKPGPVDRRPSFLIGHMPRLDWQMWFAALRGHCGRAPWYQAFLRRLLEAEEQVLALIEEDPFGGRRPRSIRSTLYRYRFTTEAEREASGAYWRRERLRPYCPTVELSARGLRPVR